MALSDPILHLWDEYSGHWTAEVRDCAKFLNIVLLKVSQRAPPQLASQSADIAWNIPLKSRLRRCWLDYLQYQAHQHPQYGGFVATSATAQASNDITMHFGVKCKRVQMMWVPSFRRIRSHSFFNNNGPKGLPRHSKGHAIDPYHEYELNNESIEDFL